MVSKGRAITKRISRRKLESIRKQFQIKDEDQVFNDLMNQSRDDALRYIVAAHAAILDAGEAISNQGIELTRHQKRVEERTKLLNEDLSIVAMLVQLEYFLQDPEECQKFVGLLEEEARQNLKDALQNV